MDTSRYLAGKSSVLQDILALSDLTEQEKLEILKLNTPDWGIVPTAVSR